MAKDNKQAHQAPKPPTSAAPPGQEIDIDAARAEFDAMEGTEVAGSGFPPYMKPVVGGLYIFTPVMTDARNPKFVRHTVIHHGPTPVLICATGPVEDAEPVEVKAGEVYNISDYKGIPFDDLIGLRVTALCTERRKLGPMPDGTARAPMFMFKFKLSDEDAKTFAERKSSRGLAQAQALRAQELARRAAAVNGLPVTPSSGAPARSQGLPGVAG